MKEHRKYERKNGVLRMKIEKIIYMIKKKICDIIYKRLTYIPERGLWVSTVVFPVEIIDGVYGVTDVFRGDNKKVNFESLYSVYIKKISNTTHIHGVVVDSIKRGYILKNEVKM